MKSLKEWEKEDLQVLATRQAQELTSLQSQGLCYQDYNIGRYQELGGTTCKIAWNSNTRGRHLSLLPLPTATILGYQVLWEKKTSGDQPLESISWPTLEFYHDKQKSPRNPARCVSTHPAASFPYGGWYLYHLDAIIWSCSNHKFPRASLRPYWTESTQHTCCENEVSSITKNCLLS